MTCKICGQPLPEGSTVCKYCGAHVRTGSAPEKKPARRYSKKGLARKRMINMIITLLALLLIAVVVVGVVWSAKQASEKGQGTLQGDGSLEDQSGTRPVDPSNVPDTDKKEDEPEDTQKPEEQDKEEVPNEPQQPEQKPEAEDPKEDDPKEEEPKEEPTTPQQPEQKPEEQKPAEPQQPSGKYTISINRTETTASLNHYRELYVYINETLPAGVKVEKTTWTSSDPSIVRADPGKAWGISVGTATVTGTIHLSDGQTLSASCKVNVVERQVVSDTNYVLPESSTRTYTKAELSSLTDQQLWIARNEIYARHGRLFSNQELQTYFNGKSWYKGTIKPEDFDESVLSSVERENVKTIQAVEASR